MRDRDRARVVPRCSPQGSDRAVGGGSVPEPDRGVGEVLLPVQGLLGDASGGGGRSGIDQGIRVPVLPQAVLRAVRRAVALWGGLRRVPAAGAGRAWQGRYHGDGDGQEQQVGKMPAVQILR
ncbi:unnamed protein product [Linum tenue]|uniref:Uncharacterized protein n=1 Tax=Linum tenue TaxID=586396 RepID=A0AAV0KG45_9ROSI|nr:unnamed protein product [Linum tenue]